MTTNMVRTRKNETNTPASSFPGLVDQLFQDNLSRFFNDDVWGFQGLHKVVPMNLQETDKTYELDIIAPGLRKEDFHLNVTDDMLTISYDRSSNKNEEKINWLRQEYKVESFTRNFSLDDSIDAANITANYNNGILHLTLPKKEQAQKAVRKIDIQ